MTILLHPGKVPKAHSTLCAVLQKIGQLGASTWELSGVDGRKSLRISPSTEEFNDGVFETPFLEFSKVLDNADKLLIISETIDAGEFSCAMLFSFLALFSSCNSLIASSKWLNNLVSLFCCFILDYIPWAVILDIFSRKKQSRS